MTTVVLADDEALLRKALAALLALEGDITVLAEAQDGESAVRATLDHRPDVLVIDLEMPGWTAWARSPRSAAPCRTR